MPATYQNHHRRIELTVVSSWMHVQKRLIQFLGTCTQMGLQNLWAINLSLKTIWVKNSTLVQYINMILRPQGQSTSFWDSAEAGPRAWHGNLTWEKKVISSTLNTAYQT